MLTVLIQLKIVYLHDYENSIDYKDIATILTIIVTVFKTHLPVAGTVSTRGRHRNTRLRFRCQYRSSASSRSK